NGSQKNSTSTASAMTQAAIWQLVTDSMVAALEAQATNMANTDNTNKNTGPRETPAELLVSSVGLSKLNQKMEDEFYNLVVKGNDLKTYARRFQDLATLCLNMVLNNEKLMEVFIGGLPQSIEGTVTTSKPQTLKKAINKAQRLLNQVKEKQENDKIRTNQTKMGSVEKPGSVEGQSQSRKQKKNKIQSLRG
nr:reverse transcriptase domain-containing protein [Tanacetum cinerariifolium]